MRWLRRRAPKPTYSWDSDPDRLAAVAILDEARFTCPGYRLDLWLKGYDRGIIEGDALLDGECVVCVHADSWEATARLLVDQVQAHRGLPEQRAVREIQRAAALVTRIR